MKRTNIICIASHKGGVGKTTTAATLGSMLSARGERTLLVDLDAQRNLTSTFLGTQNKPENTIFEAFCGKCPLPVVNVRENLDIVPSSLDMGALDTTVASRIQRESILDKLVRPIRNDYKWIFLDCPSQMGIVTVNAFAAATSLIVPISCDAYAAEGLMQLLDMAEIVGNGLNPLLDLDGIIVTRYHTTRNLDKMVDTDLRAKFRNLVFKTKIRENATIVQAPVMQLDIFSYDPKCKGALDYAALLEEIIAKMEQVQNDM